MLTIRATKDHGHALGEYLRQADYYSLGQQIEGLCYGHLCSAVGLEAGQPITDEQFAALAGNLHATTGEQLTARMAAGRRAGYDAVWSAPKTVSIQAFLGGDERVIQCHERATLAAVREMERYACRQEGQGVAKMHTTTAALAAAIFRHGESRALDPQLHSHVFLFNVTTGADSKFAALETSEIFSRTRYLTEVYRSVLAGELSEIGYEIRRTENGFELAGVPEELIARFAKRAQERDAAVAVREKELGRELSANETAVIVRDNRARKLCNLNPKKCEGGSSLSFPQMS